MKSLSVFLFVLFSIASYASESIRVVSYNCENMFDTIHCEGKQDMEFTPLGAKNWTAKKFKRKMRNIASVLTAVGEWRKPAVIGLLEVESEFVLQYLTEKTQLAAQHYRYLHKESNDERGIDVALLYDSAQFVPVAVEYLNVDVEERATREILFATGRLTNGDTLNVFVNHWPSRYGGELVSEHRRHKAARVLRAKVDSLFRINQRCNIVIMGDFNDYANNSSIADTLGARALQGAPKPFTLYNLMYKYYGSESIGTHYFQRHWGILDHIIVSPSMLDIHSRTYCRPGNVGIFYEDFLLEGNAIDVKVPKRSFKGDFFNSYGYSDHLPVYLDIFIEK